jgi:hypothetical protein
MNYHRQKDQGIAENVLVVETVPAEHIQDVVAMGKTAGPEGL